MMSVTPEWVSASQSKVLSELSHPKLQSSHFNWLQFAGKQQANWKTAVLLHPAKEDFQGLEQESHKLRRLETTEPSNN